MVQFPEHHVERNFVDWHSSCPILIGNDTRINTSNHEPDPDFDTILRVLEVLCSTYALLGLTISHNSRSIMSWSRNR